MNSNLPFRKFEMTFHSDSPKVLPLLYNASSDMNTLASEAGISGGDKKRHATV